MKILLINNRHFHGGGADIVYFNTAKLLQEYGHEVVFFSLHSENEEESEWSEFFAPATKDGNALQKVKRYCFNDAAARKLQELIDKEHPDIAHIHLMWGGMTVSILEVLKKNNIPSIHTIHDYRMVCPAYTFKDGNGKVCERCKKNAFYNCALHKCSKGKFIESTLMTFEMYFRNLCHNPLMLLNGIVFVSNFSKQKHLDHNCQFSCIQNTVLYNYTNPVLAQSNQKGDYYLFYGRLSHEKGISTLINAFGRMPDLTLKIVGTGPLEHELKTLCNEKCYENIQFLGYHSGGTLFELVRNAKFVCVPSECYENNPMTIVESYSYGVPVIGARIGGIPEIIEEGKTGYTFESGNSEDLFKVISNTCLLNDEQYSNLVRNAYSFYENNFSKEKHYESLMRFYNQVINSYK